MIKEELATLITGRSVRILAEESGVTERIIYHARNGSYNMTINNIEALLDSMGYELKIKKVGKERWKE